MNDQKRLFEMIKTGLIIVSLHSLTNCSQVSFPQKVSPHVTDIPLIKKKGDLRVDVGLSIFVPDTLMNNDESNMEGTINVPSVQGSISYGISNMLALQMSANVSLETMYYLQTALGLFKGFENKMVMEFYGGFGYGSSIIGGWLKTNTHYNHPYIQFNIGQVDLGARHIDYGLGMKAGYIYANILTDAHTYTFLNDRSLVMEPCIFFRFGRKKAKFNIKANYLWTNCAVVDEYYRFTPFKLTMGINFSY